MHTAKNCIIFIRAGAAKISQLAPFSNVIPRDWKIEHFHIRMNPLTAEHFRDLFLLRRLTRRLQKQNFTVHVFGYSIGGKFAARIAYEMSEVRSVFLLDPVDGGPPFFADSWFHLPVFFTRQVGLIKQPVWLVETELGECPHGPLGIACVNKGLGAEHFAAHCVTDQLERLRVENAGHLQVIAELQEGTLKSAQDSACASGSRPRTDIIAEVIAFFTRYIGTLVC